MGLAAMPSILGPHRMATSGCETRCHRPWKIHQRITVTVQMDYKIARVMTFGYDASVLTKASSQRSFTFAESLLSELKDRRHGQAANRPLIFLGHSLGGIVIKKGSTAPSYNI